MKKKLHIKIYEATVGNRWNDFVARNRHVFDKESLIDGILRNARKLLKKSDSFIVSRRRIEQLTKDPQLLSPQKSLKMTRRDNFFIIGCCFSRYIRSILEQIPLDVHPKFLTLKFDPAKIVVATLPRKYSLAWYNTFTMRQEFEKIFGSWVQSPDDVWVLPDNDFLSERYPRFKGKTIYADPYRRHTFSIDKRVLYQTTQEIDRLFKEGIEKSDAIILTLGLTDAFRKRDSGKVCCAMPNFFDFEKEDRCELVLGGYEDNYQNLKTIMVGMEQRYPQKKVIFMVAPVALAATFTGDDIYLATEESKAVLRAAAIKVSREFKNAHYFPAFEIFQLMSLAARKRYRLYNNQSMRNLSMASVEKILAYFLKTYFDVETWGSSGIKIRFSDTGE